MAALDDNSLMPFGKYKDEKLANVPASYLLYAYDNFNIWQNLKDYIDDNRDVLESEIK